MQKFNVRNFVILSMMLNSITSAASSFCGPGGSALFQPKHVFECVVASNTCEVESLLSEGWLRSANGKCPRTPKPMFCGAGGTEMVNLSTGEFLKTLDSCDTDALFEMGWIIATPTIAKEVNEGIMYTGLVTAERVRP